MGLSLVVGPAHAGKVAHLLERYLATLERDPWLIVPNRADVERVERDLLRRRGALLGGNIGTFDDLFDLIAAPGETLSASSSNCVASRSGTNTDCGVALRGDANKNVGTVDGQRIAMQLPPCGVERT